MRFLWFYYRIIYNLILLRLRSAARYRKLRIGFWVTESDKWTCGKIYDYLKNDDRFEPFILLSYFKKPRADVEQKVFYRATREFFECSGCKVYEVYEPETQIFKDLMDFKPDVIFYQQPWQISDIQRPERTHCSALLCYVPYCFYSLDSHINYLDHFHGLMWRYFVETNVHGEEYRKRYGAENCVTAGSVKLDGWNLVSAETAEKYWKTTGKKRIIYAPHHSFNDGLHEVATFEGNGRYILELAQKHPETEWIFRPHPLFKERIIKNSIMTEAELDEYIKEWESVGSISEGGNYLEMFYSSDVLITDCISFLSEYALTTKPVIHLRRDFQKEDFNGLIKELDKGYYQVYSNSELGEIFDRVVVRGDDYLKEQREKNKKLLPSDISAGRNIYEYLVKALVC